ncbi:MAG: hypothetical protein JJ992_21675 [Planctomycetes bacterium]|nr:hypothetical protein [Planctomycetota bacterium]
MVDSPIPIFVADMQTTNGGDTANLRWSVKATLGADVSVAEQQSLALQSWHVEEQAST